jgi:glycosyltransferase involved in cell wall biosynthesis
MSREIVVNGRFLSRRVTGVERYGREIMTFIGSRCRLEKTGVNGLAGHAWEQLILSTKLTAESILWSPANTGPLMVHNQALTIHDLSPLEHPDWFTKSFSTWYRLFLPILAKRSKVIFTPSAYVKQKVEKSFGVHPVIVTPNGVDTSRFHPDAKQDGFRLPERYILFVGSLQPRKNLQALLCAWNAIQEYFPEVWLVIAGDAGTVFKPIQLNDDERVRFLGYVTEADLPGLYADAILFVLPSLDEGFGLPALEAMACGTPVIVSNAGALPEVVGDAGSIFDGSKPNDLANAMQEVLCNENLRLRFKERGLARAKNFSWQRTAELIWNTLHEI